jgi:AcrR family transcriptional regulator
MSKPVKRRAYQSPARQEQAAQTRARIVEAADHLFVTIGYARTTIRQIADRANVASDTVYATFGSKARILTAVIDARLAPAEGVSNVLDRPEAQAVRDELDQRRQLHLFARDITAISERVRPVYEIMRTAAAVEPAMATVFAEMNDYRFANMRRAAEWLAARGPLRVDVERAAEIIWALASPDVSQLLCDTRGWTSARYADWLEDTLARTLLPDPAPSPKPTRRR